jgi:hypothetical protein
MHLEKNTTRGSGYPLQNKTLDTPISTLNFSASGVNNGSEAFNDPELVQKIRQLLKEHETTLQKVIRRNEAFQLKPFPRYMNQREVINYLGHEKVFLILVEEYGLKPIRQEHRINIYCSKQVEEKCTMFEHNIAP